MRTKVENGTVKVWLSARDTRQWARKPSAAWPCSFLSGRRIRAEFALVNDTVYDLIDVAIDGGRGDQDCPSDEFNALMDDYLDRNPACRVCPSQPDCTGCHNDGVPIIWGDDASIPEDERWNQKSGT